MSYRALIGPTGSPRVFNRTTQAWEDRDLGGSGGGEAPTDLVSLAAADKYAIVSGAPFTDNIVLVTIASGSGWVLTCNAVCNDTGSGFIAAQTFLVDGVDRSAVWSGNGKIKTLPPFRFETSLDIRLRLSGNGANDGRLSAHAIILPDA